SSWYTVRRLNRIGETIGAMLGLTILLAASLTAQEAPTPVFGTTVVSSAGFEGKIYHLKGDSEVLPHFGRMKSVGSIYTTSLNVPPQSFRAGFPGITNRFEWFAIDYQARFWVEEEGRFDFGLLSDDGSKLWIDGALVADNDGIHA